MTTRVLEYGCVPEHYGGYDELETAIDTLRLADRLWNTLVDIAHNNRIEFRRLTSDPLLEASLKAKDDAIAALKAEIKQRKVQERKRRIQVDPARAQAIGILRDERKLLCQALGIKRVEMKQSNAQALEALRLDIKRRYDTAMKEENNRLNQTMRNPLLQRFKAALAGGAKTAREIIRRKLESGRTLDGLEGLPRYRRPDGTGIITVSFTNGLAVSKPHVWKDGVGKFQIGASDPTYAAMTSNRGRSQEQLANYRRELRHCRIALSTEVNRKPLWLTSPVIFHRTLPDTAEIRSVAAKRDVIGGRARWKICITIRTDKPPKTSNVAPCGVHVGWRRKTDASNRVAYLVDESGHQ
jgi:hypothetical protein